MRAVKGERGEQGEQGQKGEPSTSCVCSLLIHGELTRRVSSKGRRSLCTTDKFVIVDSIESCEFMLPEVVSGLYTDADYEDCYYYPVIIKILVNKGMHLLRVRGGSVINSHYLEYDLDKRALYTAVSLPGGNWIVMRSRS